MLSDARDNAQKMNLLRMMRAEGLIRKNDLKREAVGIDAGKIVSLLKHTFWDVSLACLFAR